MARPITSPSKWVPAFVANPLPPSLEGIKPRSGTMLLITLPLFAELQRGGAFSGPSREVAPCKLHPSCSLGVETSSDNPHPCRNYPRQCWQQSLDCEGSAA